MRLRLLPSARHSVIATAALFVFLSTTGASLAQQDCDSSFVATFTWADQGNNVALFNGSNNGNAIWHWWDFGDGITGVGDPTQHFYQQPGQYYVCYMAGYYNQLTQDTCWADHCMWVVVQGGGGICQDYEAAFTWGPMGPNTAQFTTAYPPPPPGLFMQFVWDFGDGTATSGNVPATSHVYTSPGLYVVCLTVWLLDSMQQVVCTDTLCQNVIVQGGGGAACDSTFTASFTYVDQGNNIALFDGSNTGNAIWHWWDFGDGTTGVGDPTQHFFQQPGQHYVCYMAGYYNQLTQDTCWADHCAWIIVQGGGGNNPCDSLSAYFTAWPGGLGVNFQNDVVSSQVNYSWDFGDGTTGSGPNPFHSYAQTGSYYACCTVWALDAFTQDTCWADYCAWVTAQWGGGNNPCDSLSAFFTAWPGGLGVNFQNDVVSSQVNYSWDFGDGTSGSGPSPFHIYPQAGSYSACCTVWALDVTLRSTKSSTSSAIRITTVWKGNRSIPEHPRLSTTT